jgi:hypothetical protein
MHERRFAVVDMPGSADDNHGRRSSQLMIAFYHDGPVPRRAITAAPAP